VTAQLWGRRSRLVLGAGWSAGLLIVFLGWWGTSGRATAGQQFRWVGVAVAGLIVCLAVSAAWVFTGMRAVGTRIRVVVPRPSDVPGPVVELRAVADSTGGRDDALVAAPGMRYFHRPSCRLAQGKAVRPAERAVHVREGRSACGVCRPDRSVGVSAA
jgi:hypothetical protein